MKDEREWIVGEYEDGWFVERPDPDDIDCLITVAGPFASEGAAEEWIDAASVSI